jgi:drug/metabolite transporter (DMT)-like permease
MTLNLVSLLGFALLLAVGQFLFKRSALAIAGQHITGSLATLAALPSFYAAVLLYGGSTVLWVWILTRVPLGLAYPFVAVAMIIVPAMGWYFFGERLNVAYWLGVAVIIAGMLVMQLAR